MFNLEGKTALITGATGGIGGAIADALFGAGANLVVSGSTPEKLQPLLDKYGTRAKAIPCDLSQLHAIDTFIKQAEEAFGGIDILICNAGVTRDTLSLRMKDEDWQRVLDVNLTASFKMARASLKGLMKREHARIIFITSVVGHSGNPGQTNYCAAKAGLTGMSKALAQEVAARGVTVNCVAPGFIATPMTDKLNEDQKARITQNIPLQRMGSPEDIAAAALYLASTEAAYVTGTTLHVNGGLWMG